MYLKRKDDILVKLVAKRMRQLRIERGYSLEYVVECTRLDVPHFETGLSFPTLFSISLLCKFYDITLNEFFAPINYPPKGSFDISIDSKIPKKK